MEICPQALGAAQHFLGAGVPAPEDVRQQRASCSVGHARRVSLREKGHADRCGGAVQSQAIDLIEQSVHLEQVKATPKFVSKPDGNPETGRVAFFTENDSSSHVLVAVAGVRRPSGQHVTDPSSVDGELDRLVRGVLQYDRVSSYVSEGLEEEFHVRSTKSQVGELTTHLVNSFEHIDLLLNQGVSLLEFGYVHHDAVFGGHFPRAVSNGLRSVADPHGAAVRSYHPVVVYVVTALEEVGVLGLDPLLIVGVQVSRPGVYVRVRPLARRDPEDPFDLWTHV
ncbi:MAG: hypothetical protein WD670_05245, partial [Actinomycetota bacterium]